MGPASEAFANRESLLAVTCSAPGKRFPAMSLSVGIRLGDVFLRARFPEITAGGSATRVLPFLPERRGLIAGASCTVSTRFPFALFEKSMDVSVAASLLVYPAPADGEEPGARSTVSDPSGVAADAGRQGTGIRGARDHMVADPVRDIHWKASARMGKWMVEEREREAAPVTDIRLAADCPPEEFESRVSRACSFVLRSEMEGRPYRLWTGNLLRVDASRGGCRSRALSFLAMVSADCAASPAGT
jgi:uncharacterized protein (DUF58 family)